MERKSSAYPNSDDTFSTYAPKTYMENMPCELAFRVFCQNDAKGIANSEDPDQTAPLGAV